MSTETEEEERPTSVIFDHCVAVYGEMKSQAREEDLSDTMDIVPPESAQEMRLVYEGHLTKLFAGLGLSTPYYTAIMGHLKAMGCVEQLRRGGGNSPSRWMLVRPPDEEAFKSIETRNRHSRGKTAAVEQQIRDLTVQINALSARLSNVEAVMTDLTRLAKTRPPKDPLQEAYEEATRSS